MCATGNRCLHRPLHTRSWCLRCQWCPAPASSKKAVIQDPTRQSFGNGSSSTTRSSSSGGREETAGWGTSVYGTRRLCSTDRWAHIELWVHRGATFSWERQSNSPTTQHTRGIPALSYCSETSIYSVLPPGGPPGGGSFFSCQHNPCGETQLPPRGFRFFGTTSGGVPGEVRFFPPHRDTLPCCFWSNNSSKPAHPPKVNPSRFSGRHHPVSQAMLKISSRGYLSPRLRYTCALVMAIFAC